MTIDRLKLKYFINGELIFIQVMELFSFEIFSGKICGIPSFFFRKRDERRKHEIREIVLI